MCAVLPWHQKSPALLPVSGELMLAPRLSGELDRSLVPRLSGELDRPLAPRLSGELDRPLAARLSGELIDRPPAQLVVAFY